MRWRIGRGKKMVRRHIMKSRSGKLFFELKERYDHIYPIERPFLLQDRG